MPLKRPALECGKRLGMCVGDPARKAQLRLAIYSEFDGAGSALEQRLAQSLFQPFDLLAHGLLRAAGLAGCGCEAASVVDGEKGFVELNTH